MSKDARGRPGNDHSGTRTTSDSPTLHVTTSEDPVPDPHHVTLSSDGRIVIPAALRRALDLEPGATLVIDQRGDQLVIGPTDRSELERRIWSEDDHDDIPVWLRSA